MHQNGFLDLCAQALSNLYKIYVYTVFAVTLIPFYPITAVLIKSERTKKWSTPVFLVWSYLLSFLFLIFVKRNKAKTPNQSAVIIANHTSHLDIFLMYQILPMRNIVFMGKHEILRYPFIRTYFKGLHIPVDRSDKRQSAQSMFLAKRKLDEGWSVVIFPEGGIPDFVAPKMAAFKSGAFVIAQKAKVPIIPISLCNHFELLSEPQNTQGSAHPGFSNVYIHPIISPDVIQQSAIEYLMDSSRDLITSKL
jgi:1-acyl-sn-glycerol-3-phosphate acyltransferase